MTAAEGQKDRTIGSVAMVVIASGAVLAAIGFFGSGPRFAISVVIGSMVALLNFLVLARVGRALTEEGSNPAVWSLVYLFKILALFGGVFLLLRSASLSLLGVLTGLSSLVPGIVLGGVAASHREP